MTSITLSGGVQFSQGAGGSPTLVVIATLLILLIQKEILSNLRGVRALRLSRALNIAIVPLELVFVVVLLRQLFDTMT